MTPRREQCGAYPVSIFIAGDHAKALELCRTYCDEVGYCVTVTPTSYVYRDGQEAGVIVGLINYARFPAEPEAIEAKALALANRLRVVLEQQSFTIQTPTQSTFHSWREEASPILAEIEREND